MTLTEEQKLEVRATMEAYATAYRKNDLKAFREVFSPDICGFGSGADEIVDGYSGFIRQISRDESQAAIDGVEFSETKIFGEGRVAWVMTRSAITFTVPGGKKQTMKGRSTMVMRNNGNRWKIEQIHFSLPYGGQEKGQSFPGA